MVVRTRCANDTAQGHSSLKSRRRVAINLSRHRSVTRREGDRYLCYRPVYRNSVQKCKFLDQSEAIFRLADHRSTFEKPNRKCQSIEGFASGRMTLYRTPYSEWPGSSSINDDDSNDGGLLFSWEIDRKLLRSCSAWLRILAAHDGEHSIGMQISTCALTLGEWYKIRKLVFRSGGIVAT